LQRRFNKLKHMALNEATSGASGLGKA